MRETEYRGAIGRRLQVTCPPEQVCQREQPFWLEINPALVVAIPECRYALARRMLPSEH
jgi:hypothetical protein